jgi:Na+-driven multidrug efflux pump
MASHSLIFASQNVGGFAERALLASDPASTAALGLGWTAFSLLYAFAANLVDVSQLFVGRCAGEGDDRRARDAAGQGLLLAVGGGAVGLAIAAAAGAAAACTVGPIRGAALFLAIQGLALGPLLVARALSAYHTGTLRFGPRVLAAVGAAPIAAHVALAWLLTGLLSWSVAGAGLARLGAALAVCLATLAVVRGELGGLAQLVRRPDWRLLRAMATEGGVLGLQQATAGLLALSLYLAAARAGAVTSAALTLTHSGVYPLLFAVGWGGAQTFGAAAAQAIGRGDPRGLARVVRRCLGLSAVLAFALPWGAFAVCGGSTLAWLAGDGATAAAVLAASLQFMGLLAVFFVFDFAVNFLSALLKAAKERAFLLKATAIAAAGFGLLLIAWPSRLDGAWLMGAFIAAQAAWAALLLVRVVCRWPHAAGRSRWTAAKPRLAEAADAAPPAGNGAPPLQEISHIPRPYNGTLIAKRRPVLVPAGASVALLGRDGRAASEPIVRGAPPAAGPARVVAGPPLQVR